MPSYMFVYVDCGTLIVNRKTSMEHDVSEWDVDTGLGQSLNGYWFLLPNWIFSGLLW
jgi:hypothetical protein